MNKLHRRAHKIVNLSSPSLLLSLPKHSPRPQKRSASIVQPSTLSLVTWRMVAVMVVVEGMEGTVMMEGGGGNTPAAGMQGQQNTPIPT